MGEGRNSDLKYVLVLKDDLTSYTCLVPHSSPVAEAAVDSLSKWIAAFGSMDWLVSDRGPHLKSSIVRMITDESFIDHHISTAYCPLAHETVEGKWEEVLRAARSLFSKWV